MQLLTLVVHGQRQEVIQRKQEAASQAAWGEAGVIIEDLKAALADSQQQLRKERAARDQLEEDMKQSFMRSVCAINLEVRYLFNTDICCERWNSELKQAKPILLGTGMDCELTVQAVQVSLCPSLVVSGRSLCPVPAIDSEMATAYVAERIHLL